MLHTGEHRERACARAGALGAQPRRKRNVAAHVRHVRRIVAAAVLRVVEQPALIPQPAAEGEVPAPARLVQRRVPLSLHCVKVNPVPTQPPRRREQLHALWPGALAGRRAQPVLRAAGEDVELLRVHAVPLHQVLRDLEPVLPHRQLERRDFLRVARVGVGAGHLAQVPYHLQLAVTRSKVQRPAPLATRRHPAHAVGLQPSSDQPL